MQVSVYLWPRPLCDPTPPPGQHLPPLMVRGRPHLPFQLQVEYTAVDGARYLRIISRAQPVTEDRTVAEKGLSSTCFLGGVHITTRTDETLTLFRPGLWRDWVSRAADKCQPRFRGEDHGGSSELQRVREDPATLEVRLIWLAGGLDVDQPRPLFNVRPAPPLQ